MLKIQRAIIEVIGAVRRKGSMTGPEIEKAVKLPEKTVYRAINTTIEAELLVPQGDRYFWFEDLRKKIYRSQTEAENDLKHSQNMAAGLLSLMKTPLGLDSTGIMPKPIYQDQALQHLQVAYRLAHQNYQESQRYSEQKMVKEADLGTRLEETLNQTRTNTTNPPGIRLGKESVSSIPELVRKILNDFKEHWRTEPPDSQTVGDEVFDPQIRIGKTKTTLRKLLGDQSLEQIVQGTREIIELEYKHYSAYLRFEEQTREIILRIANGSPILGRCDHCPTIQVRTDGLKPKTQ